MQTHKVAPSSKLVNKFAAHLAHLLNTGDDIVNVQAFMLFKTLMKTLERRTPPDSERTPPGQ
jgi:hypothetical protein